MIYFVRADLIKGKFVLHNVTNEGDSNETFRFNKGFNKKVIF